MREIKFRVWDVGLKKFHYPELWDSSMPSNWKSYYELNQYTGLKDKNGKEIFESDLVEDHIGIGVVKYAVHNAAFRVCYVRGEDKGRCKWFADYTLKGERESIEVVGNIYESKELLDE